MTEASGYDTLCAQCKRRAVVMWLLQCRARPIELNLAARLRQLTEISDRIGALGRLGPATDTRHAPGKVRSNLKAYSTYLRYSRIANVVNGPEL